MVSDWSFFSFIVIFFFVIVAIVSKGGLSEARSISYSKNLPETPYTYSKTHTPKPPLIISPEENLDVKKFELFLAEGDIVIDRADVGLSRFQKFHLYEPSKTSSGTSRKRRSVESQYYKTWFNRTVPYIFDLDFPLEGRWMVEEAMRDIQNRSCLHFKKRTQEVDYLRFKSDIGSASCYSAVGRTGGEQVLGLRDGCFVHGIIQHELLHALGFWHEHSRRDRDEYINVIWDNIPEVHKENFRLQTVLQSNELLLRMPYDYGSVMHYANNSFAKDRSRPTIVPTQELAGGQVMGQREGVSHGDVDKLNALYRCDIFNCTRPDPPSHGHVNGSDFSVGARISYGCEPDYLLIGAPERVCRDLGEWSGEQPSCLWPASQIYYCNFDSAQSPLCGMSQGTDEMLDWLHQTGPTLSKETGPYFDHTLATAYGGYLYVEASSVGSQPVGNVAKLILNNPLSTSHSSMTCLVFFTYMYGENMGSLKVYLSSSAQSGFTTTNQLFSMSGDQGQQWHQIFLVLPQSFQSGTILLEATVGNGYRSDIAIDDLVVAPCAQLGPLAASGGLPETLECSFDLDLCSFQQDEQDDFEWVLRSGKTVTFDTGPDCDPLNCLTGKYLYIESSRPRMLGDTAVLKTPVTGGEGKRCLSFYYHMYGIHIGSLVVRQISALTRSSVTLWAMSGDQGNRWHSKHIEFDSMEAYWISLTATVGNGYKGDIAIDSISLAFGRCTASMRFDCSFKHDLCGWMNAPLLAHALQWSRHTGETDTPDTGPSGDRLSPTGYYLYVEASRTLPGDAAHLVSPALTGSSQGHCLVFWYHMYGENSGNLTVYSQTEQGQDSVLWSVHGNQGENWHSATVNVSSVPGESFNIVFEATMAGWKGDVAIDDVSIRYTRCGS